MTVPPRGTVPPILRGMVLVARGRAQGLNCFRDTVFRDVDFGASVIQARLNHGTDIVLGGQKSGTLWALEPTTGKLLWRRHLGSGWRPWAEHCRALR